MLAQGNALGRGAIQSTSPERAAQRRWFKPPLQGSCVFSIVTQGVALGYNKPPLWGWPRRLATIKPAFARFGGMTLKCLILPACFAAALLLAGCATQSTDTRPQPPPPFFNGSSNNAVGGAIAATVGTLALVFPPKESPAISKEETKQWLRESPAPAYTFNNP